MNISWRFKNYTFQYGSANEYIKNLNVSFVPYQENNWGDFSSNARKTLEYTSPLDNVNQAIIIAIYAMTVLFAVTGNIIVIIILVFGNRSRSDLTTFLVNLAISDVGMALFCMPFTFTQAMLGTWQFGEFMCTFVLFAQVLMVSVSVFTNMSIGIDRYLAVKYPLRRRLTKAKAGIVLCIVWAFSFALASVQLAVARVSRNYGAHTNCNENWPHISYRLGYTVFLFLSTYLLPLIAISLSYYCIGKVLWEYNAPGNADEVRDQLQLQSKRRVIKMLVAVVVLFAVCWLPLHLWSLVLDAKPDLLSLLKTETHERIYYAAFFASHWLAMANSFSNPVIYGFMNENFRTDLKLFCHSCVSRDSCNKGSSRWNRSARFQNTRTSVRATMLSRTNSLRHDRTYSRQGSGRFAEAQEAGVPNGTKIELKEIPKRRDSVLMVNNCNVPK